MKMQLKTKTRISSAPEVSEAMTPSKVIELANGHWRNGAYKKALQYFMAADALGDSSSAEVIGNFYHFGTGAKKNIATAKMWYRRAYKLDKSLVSAYNLGLIYKSEKNKGLATKWLNRAVELGDGDAAFELAKIYMSKPRGTRTAVSYLASIDKYEMITPEVKKLAHKLLKNLTAR